MTGTTYEGRKAATPRAMASATPGIIRSRSARSSTETLEISTAIAGAAVVRNCRIGAICAVSGEPLKRLANSACTMSPSLWLSHSKRRLRLVPWDQPGGVASHAAFPALHRYEPCPPGRWTRCECDEHGATLRIGARGTIVKRRVFVAFARLQHLKPLALQRASNLRGENSITTSLSRMPSVPRAPRSVPPCAGSRTTMLRPTLGAWLNGVAGGAAGGACVGVACGTSWRLTCEAELVRIDRQPGRYALTVRIVARKTQRPKLSVGKLSRRAEYQISSESCGVSWECVAK